MISNPTHSADLAALATAALARAATAPAIEFQGHWYCWGDLRQVADELHAVLLASGVDAHAPVVFLPRNRPSAVAALLGMVAHGRVVRMAYPFQSPASVVRDMRRLQPALVIAAAEDFSPELVAELQAQGAAAVALTEMHARAVPGREQVQRAQPELAPGAPRIEILTSGTTGPPKPFAIELEVIARHYVGSAPTAAEAADAAEQVPALLYFPVSNISGVYTTLPSLLKGQRAVLLDRFSVTAWHDFILRYRPLISGLPPAGVQMVLAAGIPKADLAGIRQLGTGAAPLDPTVHRAFEDHYGIPILLSYGATEFVGPVCAMTFELHQQFGRAKFGSCGRAMPGARLRVIDPDSGAELPPGQEGLLQVVSPRVGPDWITTSDIAMIDSDGFLFHRGRADGAIMRGGFKLLPETIERALLLHPAIGAAAVTAVSDHRLGQVPGAAVQFKPEATPLSLAELERHVRDHIPATHIPVHWRIVAQLPRTPSLKVDRPALRALFASASPG
jgi:long-chain acyl-CoA synthetase